MIRVLMATVNIVCAWCGTHLGSYEDKQGGVSHGICASCADKMKPGKGGK